MHSAMQATTLLERFNIEPGDEEFVKVQSLITYRPQHQPSKAPKCKCQCGTVLASDHDDDLCWQCANAWRLDDPPQIRQLGPQEFRECLLRYFDSLGMIELLYGLPTRRRVAKGVCNEEELDYFQEYIDQFHEAYRKVRGE